ncbi:MAG: queuosine precursor transporter [Methanosphaera sp.]|uniref:queuosine precursor transporter n=1 Tax=Methanosphaera sp. TaxID=2666342 RepID=UPI002A80AE02|nr:queuosine precursor transporter [Methanosphaera sp.]MDY3955500.1 queuosine precursor transporter [Methanosphaera sp.]
MVLDKLKDNVEVSYIEKRLIIKILFCISLTIANILTIKLVDINIANLVAPASVIIYPLTYVLISIITTVYGEKTAQKTLILGIITVVLFVFMTTLLLYVPSPGFYKGDVSLNYVFQKIDSIAVGSLIAYIIGNLITIKLTGNISRSNNKFKYKNFFAIAIGLLIDDLLYLAISSIGLMPFSLGLLINYWLFNIVWLIIAEPFTLRAIKWAKS